MADDDDNEQENIQPRPFWSGIIAFGLVSLPVSLFPANRGRSFSLKMVDDDGAPLNRRYFCSKDEEPLEQDDIVRGYEIEKDHFVVVDDEELEALAPEKSQEIDLKRFVSLSDINPIYFERGYFLVPDEGANKAYRLLAKSMQDEQRAGIATFVMRGKEYLVAIISEKGILRAQTLRFHAEVRSPSWVGLPERQQPEKSLVTEMRKAMKALVVDALERNMLIDRQTQRTLALIEKKRKSGKDVLKAPEEAAEAAAESTNVIDLMQVLKDRLAGRTPETGDGVDSIAVRRDGGKDEKPPHNEEHDNLESNSKDELYELAKELDIAGRSSMSKRQLVDAIRHQH